jgi:hypothetical protein
MIILVEQLFYPKCRIKSFFIPFSMKKQVTLFTFFMLVRLALLAQMPHDAIYMPKNISCIAVTYSNSNWNQYWEYTLKRDNPNMGKHTTQSVMPMLAYGISNKLNLIAALPYIQTKTSAGNLMGQKGLQDASLLLKYKLAEKSGLSLHTVVGGSLPVSNYVPDFLPMSIGLQAKTLTGRLLANYLHKTGMYVTAHASYILRSNIKIDRDAYQADGRVYNTNEVRVPNATDMALRLGYIKDGSRIQAEVFAERFTCVGGDNIRRNDMPFPSNNMEATNVGFYGKCQPKNIGFNVRIARVIDGLNVGQATSYSLGLLYILETKKK